MKLRHPNCPCQYDLEIQAWVINHNVNPELIKPAETWKKQGEKHAVGTSA